MMRNLPRINTHKYSETTEDLSSDSPKYSSPFASSAAIYRDFIPPIFLYVRYLEANCFKYFFLRNFIRTEETLSAQIMYGAPVSN